ncbi:Uncharacterised protein [Vibrio cholerae]|nr:Uncharacterised protein [Vibrio cholerae]
MCTYTLSNYVIHCMHKGTIYENRNAEHAH